ncbi:prokaryotic phospholipase A2-domain-containing protein [Lasiosphaeris hirsuta]|uniref:Prokaryotic phospholipase A2-domain-containing protein n=1 Tax=Lasiosphaeris hirsuta TaxID=260670 RepID=A0AA40A9J1_9PEZI|nr:prokaryotic phospholipase A2-domain-containing protein [Lasiosphaeris hirsuta]
MKPTVFPLLLAAAGSALSADDRPQSKRQGLEDITDQYLFSLSLPQFTAKHNARDPAALDWTTDNCTLSPDNPLGFPFVPACRRHDFGYNNYQGQNRFTVVGKRRIDEKFKTDLYYQCSTEVFMTLCRALAEVYYAAVRAFGGLDASKRDEGLIREYEEMVAVYNALVEVAQRYGDVAAGTGMI